MRLSILLLTVIVTGSCAGVDTLPTSECRVAELDFAVLAGADGDGFLSISGLTVGSDGTAFVLDGGDGSLIAFAPEGDEIWRVRGVEAGIADFDDPTGLHRQGELLVFRDLAGDRISLWTEFGEGAGSLELMELGIEGYPRWIGMIGAGRVALVLADDQGGGDLGPVEAHLVVYRGGSRPDTIASFELPEPVLLHLAGHEIPVLPPYLPEASLAVSADGFLALARGAEYLVEVFDAEGRPWSEIRGDDTAPAITLTDRREFGRLLPDTLLIGQLEFPSSHPPITSIAMTADQGILVRTSWSRRGEVRWDRWRLNGEGIDSFMLPATIQMVGGVGNLVYGIAVDEVGASRLEVYRIGGMGRCPGPAASPASATGPGFSQASAL